MGFRPYLKNLNRINSIKAMIANSTKKSHLRLRVKPAMRP